MRRRRLKGGGREVATTQNQSGSNGHIVTCQTQGSGFTSASLCSDAAQAYAHVVVISDKVAFHIEKDQVQMARHQHYEVLSPMWILKGTQ